MSAPLQQRNPNSMVATTWLASCAYSPNTLCTPIRPVAEVLLTDSHTRRVEKLNSNIATTMSALLAPISTTPSEAKTRADSSLASELKLELMFVGGQVASLTRKRADVLTMDVFVAENLETIERALFIVESRQTAIIKLLTEARGQHRGHQPHGQHPACTQPFI